LRGTKFLHVEHLCIMECELLTRADAVSNMHRKTSENMEQIPSLTRANSTYVLDEGLRIGGIGRQMNSKVNQSNKVYI
jgi:hypothetical protein